MQRQAAVQREALLERRQENNVILDALWEQLSLAQKFAASSLIQFGYELAYIRNSKVGSLAILLCNDNPATISTEGEINTTPNIVIRSK